MIVNNLNEHFLFELCWPWFKKPCRCMSEECFVLYNSTALSRTEYNLYTLGSWARNAACSTQCFPPDFSNMNRSSMSDYFWVGYTHDDVLARLKPADLAGCWQDIHKLRWWCIHRKADYGCRACGHGYFQKKYLCPNIVTVLLEASDRQSNHRWEVPIRIQLPELHSPKH